MASTGVKLPVGVIALQHPVTSATLGRAANSRKPDPGEPTCIVRTLAMWPRGCRNGPGYRPNFGCSARYSTPETAPTCRSRVAPEQTSKIFRYQLKPKLALNWHCPTLQSQLLSPALASQHESFSNNRQISRTRSTNTTLGAHTTFSAHCPPKRTLLLRHITRLHKQLSCPAAAFL